MRSVSISHYAELSVNALFFDQRREKPIASGKAGQAHPLARRVDLVDFGTDGNAGKYRDSVRKIHADLRYGRSIFGTLIILFLL